MNLCKVTNENGFFALSLIDSCQRVVMSRSCVTVRKLPRFNNDQKVCVYVVEETQKFVSIWKLEDTLRAVDFFYAKRERKQLLAGYVVWNSFVIDANSVIKVKWAFIWLINASSFSDVLCNYLIKPEERPKVYFPSFLETKISVSEVHILRSFPTRFQRFSLKFGENVADNRSKKPCRGIFIFGLFQKLWLF